MKRDLRFAIRMLLKQPGFSLVAILTLALGIGVTSAVFSLIQGVLLTPPPYNKPQQLVLVLVQSARTDVQKEENPRGWPSQQFTLRVNCSPELGDLSPSSYLQKHWLNCSPREIANAE